MSYRITLLEQMRVVAEDGKDLGRLMDMRIRAKLGPLRQPESLRVDALLVGAREWLERLGLRQETRDEVKPETVSAIEPERIVVRATASKRRQGKGEDRRR
jgi:sporulation protein YlmC with PRC-barrel domain